VAVEFFQMNYQDQLQCATRAQGLTGELLVEFGIHNIEAKQHDITTGLFLDNHKTTH
jgi:hypothetical protein